MRRNEWNSEDDGSDEDRWIASELERENVVADCVWGLVAVCFVGAIAWAVSWMVRR